MLDASHKSHIPRLRFPEFQEDWRPSHTGEAFRNSRTKGEAGLPIYSVTMDRGLVPRDTLERHMAADAADDINLRAQKGDLVYNMMRMWQGAVGLAQKECMVSPAYVVLASKNGISSEFFNFWFKSARTLHLLWAYSQGLTNDRLRLYFDDFAQIPVHIPAFAEQEKIAAFLSAIDAKLEALRQKHTALIRYKSELMQKLFNQQVRFTRDDGSAFPGWRVTELGSVLDYLQPTNFLVTSTDYDDSFEIPVLTAGKTFILGYTNETSGIYSQQLPVIIFDDFTTASKFVDFPFKAKSSAIKLLINRSEDNSLRLIFEMMCQLNFVAGDHKRHWISEFQFLKISLPHPDEQRKIVEALSAMDAKIWAVADQISAMKAFKTGLLQQMFV